MKVTHVGDISSIYQRKDLSSIKDKNDVEKIKQQFFSPAERDKLKEFKGLFVKLVDGNFTEFYFHDDKDVYLVVDYYGN